MRRQTIEAAECLAEMLGPGEAPPGGDHADRAGGQPRGGQVTDADRRGLTPLFHTNMTPYGEIRLRIDRRLDLTDLPTA
ncbi:hypothetical protein GCM10012289_38330 [Nonomuraea cavernae]|uniref:Tn3 transposase DDE domain-containing protein n=1 Tax=Nonomuraea cavernae TaxID=2045107 RepID=A0A918DLM5_9ACTN|nr:hypothetical protein GCM10012289_38330 [Nonomuraea cavernae]